MFSLLEALIAMALTMLLIGAAVPLVATNSGIAAVAPEMIDEQQRARVGADAMMHDLVMAGAGMSVGPRAGTLLDAFAPIIPRRMGLTGADAFNVARSDAITVIYVPPSSAQSVLAQAMNSTLDSLHVDSSVGCPAGTQVCGLQQGMTAVLFDDTGRFDLVGILSLQASSATIEHHQQGIPTFSYQAGAGVAEAQAHTYYFDSANLQLRHADGAHTDVPLVDNVVAVSFDYFGDPNPPAAPRPPVGTANCLYDSTGARLPGMVTIPPGGTTLVNLPLGMFTDGPWCAAGSNQFDADLFRVRMVRVTLRVQVGIATMRGASSDFVIAGLARGSRTIPDYTIRFDIAPRNMNPGK